MIVAHGNSLRGIVKYIENLSGDQIQMVGIPNGIPLVYKFDSKMKPIKQPNAEGYLSGEFLEKKGLLRDALAREAEFYRRVPGFEDEDSFYSIFTSTTAPSSSQDVVVRSLIKVVIPPSPPLPSLLSSYPINTPSPPSPPTSFKQPSTYQLTK